MARKISTLAPQWWDYTTLDDEILNDAARLAAENMAAGRREGFREHGGRACPQDNMFR